MKCKATYNYNEPITVMTYDEYEDIRERMNARRKNRIFKDREKRVRYYFRQRVIGAMILSIGVLCLAAGCAMSVKVMQYFGSIVGLAGLYVVFTKNMVLVDEYFLERQDKINEYL